MNPTVLALTAAVLAFAGAAHAQQRALEDRYIADRDRAIKQFDGGPDDEAKTKAEEKARADLEQQMRAILGPVAPSGFGEGKLNLSTLFKGDQGFGTLDGLVFLAGDVRPAMIITTRTLLLRWLIAHKTWWKEETMPGEPGAAFRAEGFWTQAIDTDAHIIPFVEVPLGVGGMQAYAMLGSRSQDDTPRAADEVFVAAVKGERAFVANVALQPALAIASCSAARAAADKKVKELSEGDRLSGKAAEALTKRIEAMGQKAETDFVDCFARRAPKEPRWRDVVKLAKDLYGAMPAR
jgi:hypothetical protein